MSVKQLTVSSLRDCDVLSACDHERVDMLLCPLDWITVILPYLSDSRALILLYNAFKMLMPESSHIRIRALITLVLLSICIFYKCVHDSIV